MTDVIDITNEAALAHLANCISEPDLYINDPLALASAQRLWDFMGGHQCYWNDRFIVAVMCGMEEKFQRIAAWAAVSNGLTRYWEWETHNRLNTATVLKHLKIVPDNFDPNLLRIPGRFPDYGYLPHPICKAIIEKFHLPTRIFNDETNFTEEELRDRRELNIHYPKDSPL